MGSPMRFKWGKSTVSPVLFGGLRSISFSGSWLWICLLKFLKNETIWFTLAFVLPMISFAFQGSILNIVAISMERALGVVNPLGSQADPRSLKFYLLPVLVLAIGFNIPTAMEHSLKIVQVPTYKDHSDWKSLKNSRIAILRNARKIVHVLVNVSCWMGVFWQKNKKKFEYFLNFILFEWFSNTVISL